MMLIKMKAEDVGIGHKIIIRTGKEKKTLVVWKVIAEEGSELITLQNPFSLSITVNKKDELNILV